ncbi:MAG: N-6 DNA methylase [Brevinematales bacterium]|nr:N-6 DNA methylase [Brevinematales bacterium]
MSRDVLKEVIENFSEENLTEYFRQSFPGFGEEKKNLQAYQDDEFSSVKKIGEIRFSDDEKVGVFLFQSKNHISSRSSKKRQYEKAKSILKDTYLDGGIFVFSDDEGNFRFSLVYAEYKGTRREFSTYKRFTYYVSREQKNSTFLRQLGGKRITSLQELQEAFSIEKVTEEFFEAYKHAINNIIIPSLDQNIDYNKRHSFAQLFLSRIFFLYFLQKKNWLKWRNYEQDSSYIKNLWQKYKNHIRENKDKKDTFYPIWLSSLFFGAFNKKLHLISRELPEDIRESFSIMPYLNGGLFSETELDRLEFRVPDSVFEWLFEFDPTENERKRGFLETFNFTIDESLPLDVEVAIDPEMLGKVYESLIAEEERGSGGIFYTPRIEIDFMSRMSLCTYLSAQTGIQKDKIIDFVFDPHEKANLLSKQELQKVKSALENVKIVDPACGSASFLVGIMNVLLDLHCVLTKQIENKEENLFALKQHILQENLYGVDVKDWAVMVGELRLWLSLIIETDEKYMDIYTRPLLPNLSFKIRQGDSLVEEIGEMLVSLRGDSFRYLPPSIEGKIRELIDRKNAFFSGQRSADLREREEIETLEIGILKEIINFHIQTLSQKIDELEQQKSALQGQGKLFSRRNRT